MRILLAQLNTTIGDLEGNTKKILEAIAYAKKNSVQIVITPELAICGYPPEDFLLLPHFITAIQEYLDKIREASQGVTVIVGTPRRNHLSSSKHLYNSAAIFQNGELIGWQDKSLLPTYDVFAERRYFEPAAPINSWELYGKRVAITICEDLWQHSALLEDIIYSYDPVIDLMKNKPDVVLNLSASPFSTTKPLRRIAVFEKTAKTLECPVLICNQVGGNDGLIFDGYSLHIDAKGKLCQFAKGFNEDYLIVDLDKNYSTRPFEYDVTESLYNALVLGLRDYFHKSGFSKACLGLSGGIDSALVACLAAAALGRENVLGVNMPSRYSSPGSTIDASQLASKLGILYNEIPIEGPFKAYLELLEPHFEGKPPDVTEENLQARIRGAILMALSNKLGYIVLSTGNKSELAMGYATLYGDMCGGLGVINDLTKRQVYALSNWINRHEEIIPFSTIQKPPSAELRPDQKDSDTLPDYDIIDNVLEAYVGKHHSPEEIVKTFHYPKQLVLDLVRRIHRNEYKRRQSPPGLRISEKSFYVGRRFPIVQKWV